MIRSKLPNTGTTIFATMSALATECNALNLGQGFPSFPVDEVWGDLVKKHIAAGRNQYAPMPGIPELRAAIAAKLHRAYGSDLPASTGITITAGATQAIFTAISAFVHPGDEVILFAPAYDCYAPAVELNGGTVKWISLEYPSYTIPWDKVQEIICEKTRMIIINHPHNPTGARVSESDMRKLEELTSGSDIIILSDEVYEHILFDGHEHQSVLKFPGLCQRSLAVFSFGKTFHMTGWKMGYIAGPEHLMTEFRKVHQYNVFACNTPVQYALADYLEEPTHYTALPAFYQEKRDFFIRHFHHSSISLLPCPGTYFMLLNYAGWSNEKDTDVAVRWTREFGITTIPCSVFYPDRRDDKVLRLCFAKDDVTLEKGASLLSSIPEILYT